MKGEGAGVRSEEGGVTGGEGMKLEVQIEQYCRLFILKQAVELYIVYKLTCGHCTYSIAIVWHCTKATLKWLTCNAYNTQNGVMYYVHTCSKC